MWSHIRHLHEPSTHSQKSFQAQAHSDTRNERRRTSPRAPATRTASRFSQVDDFKTIVVYYSSFFLGESLLIFKLSPPRLTQHLCFNLVHSEFVFSWFEPIVLVVSVVVALGLHHWLSSHLVLQRHQL